MWNELIWLRTVTNGGLSEYHKESAACKKCRECVD
jgi:hypothetical protein